MLYKTGNRLLLQNNTVSIQSRGKYTILGSSSRYICYVVRTQEVLLCIIHNLLALSLIMASVHETSSDLFVGPT